MLLVQRPRLQKHRARVVVDQGPKCSQCQQAQAGNGHDEIELSFNRKTEN